MSAFEGDNIVSASLLNDKTALLVGLNGVYKLDIGTQKLTRVDEVIKSGLNFARNGNVVSIEMKDKEITQITVKTYE